jgi:hypothetical protein
MEQQVRLVRLETLVRRGLLAFRVCKESKASKVLLVQLVRLEILELLVLELLALQDQRVRLAIWEPQVLLVLLEHCQRMLSSLTQLE